MQMHRRAEIVSPSILNQTFVNVGPLMALLSATDHQILYGRRGTGKTHALLYLASTVESAGGWTLNVDLRQVGSATGTYSDPALSISERASRLLLDTMGSLQSRMVDLVLAAAEDEAMNFDGAMDAVDRLADAITSVRVRGNVELSSATTDVTHGANSSGLSIGTDGVSVRTESSSASGQSATETVVRSGQEEHAVHFGDLGEVLREFVDTLPDIRLWILLDEWSSVPLELQPILADLLRRCVFPVAGITVKIAAIEHRSEFYRRVAGGQYQGIELGSDAMANADLDDFLVFSNDTDHAQSFFQELLFRHCSTLMEEIGSDASDIPSDADEFVSTAFKTGAAFTELVRAAEGVPRDAINVASLAAQYADIDQIGIQEVRKAARAWYQRDKEPAVTSDPVVERLLHWIIDEVIGSRRTKGFLLAPEGIRDPNIQTLYDGRVLHLLRRGISSRDDPGIRFNAYGLDFGCYVHLTAARAPMTLFNADLDGTGESAQEVPSDDYRSIRTARLDLDDFYSSLEGS